GTPRQPERDVALPDAPGRGLRARGDGGAHDRHDEPRCDGVVSDARRRAVDPRRAPLGRGDVALSLGGRRVELRLLRDRAHYDVLVQRVLASARVSVWIATANVKELRVEAPVGTRARARGRYVSLLEVLRDLARSGVELRLLHAGVPSRAFREELAKNEE